MGLGLEGPVRHDEKPPSDNRSVGDVIGGGKDQ